MLRAKAVMPNKFWILETLNGQRSGTMSKHTESVKVAINGEETVYDSIDIACRELVISMIEPEDETVQESKEESVEGFPTKCAAFNPTWDIKRKIPVFTKTEKSRTLHAAGYYIISFETGWVPSFCPKVSTLDANEYKGPFRDKLEMREQLKKVQNASDIN